MSWALACVYIYSSFLIKEAIYVILCENKKKYLQFTNKVVYNVTERKGFYGKEISNSGVPT